MAEARRITCYADSDRPTRILPAELPGRKHVIPGLLHNQPAKRAPLNESTDVAPSCKDSKHSSCDRTEQTDSQTDSQCTDISTLNGSSS
jgi:hypothetical protein